MHATDKEPIRDQRRLLRPLAALAALALVATLIVLGLSRHSPASPQDGLGNTGDLALYSTIIDAVRGGDSYYPAAVREARNHDYPLRPAVTVRLPTYTWLMTVLPGETACRLALAVLAAATLGAWAWRLRQQGHSPARCILTLMALATGVMPAFTPPAYLLHEVWAGLLIALSLALRRPNAWLSSVMIGIAAALIRELAVPYLLAMAVLALKERRFREAAAWFAGIAIFALALAAHAAALSHYVTAADQASPGWLQIGGWSFVLRTAGWNVLLLASPDWVAAILVPLALLGLIAAPIDQRLLLIVFGYTGAFLFVGRDNNAYWGLIIAPLLPLGLVTAPQALRQCIGEIRALLQPRTLQPSRQPAG